MNFCYKYCLKQCQFIYKQRKRLSQIAKLNGIFEKSNTFQFIFLVQQLIFKAISIHIEMKMDNEQRNRKQQTMSPQEVQISQLSRYADILANLETTNSSRQHKIKFIMNETDFGTPKVDYKPGRFEFSLPERSKNKKISGFRDSIQPRKKGEPLHFKPLVDPQKTATNFLKRQSLITSKDAWATQPAGGFFSQNHYLQQQKYSVTDQVSSLNDQLTQKLGYHVGAGKLSPLPIKISVEEENALQTTRSKYGPFGSKQYAHSPRQILSQDRQMLGNNQFFIDGSLSSQQRQQHTVGQELTDDSIFEQYQPRGGTVMPHIRTFSKGSKRLKTPSNISTQMSGIGNETSQPERATMMAGAPQNQRETHTWVPQLNQQAMFGGQAPFQSRQNALRQSSLNFGGQDRVVTEEVIPEGGLGDQLQQRHELAKWQNIKFGPQRGKTQHSKLRSRILTSYLHNLSMMGGGGAQKPDTVHSNRLKAQDKMLHKQLMLNQMNLVGQSTRVSLPNKERGDFSEKPTARAANVSLQSYQKKNQKLNRSFLQKQEMQKNEGSSIEKQTDQLSSAETQRMQENQGGTARTRPPDTNRQFFDKRKTLKSQKGSVPVSTKKTVRSFVPMPSIRGSTNTTNFESTLPQNFEQSQQKRTNQYDDYSQMKPMTPSSLIPTPFAAARSQPVALSSAPSCNYQQIVSDFNEMLYSFDDFIEHQGNYLSVKQPPVSSRMTTLSKPRHASSSQNQRLATQSDATNKKVFIGELTEMQFKPKVMRNEHGQGGLQRDARTASQKDRPRATERGVTPGDAADRAERQTKAPHTGAFIMKKLQDGIKSLVDKAKVQEQLAALKAVEKAKKAKHCKKTDSSSEDSDHPLMQDEDRVKRYRCFSHDTQINIREHEIFGYQHKFSEIINVRESQQEMREARNDANMQASPYTDKLNLDLLNRDYNNATISGNELKLFLSKVNMLYAIEEEEQQPKKIDLNTIQKMFSREPSVKKIRKLTLDQMNDIIKEKSQKIRDEVYVRATHLIKMHQKEHLHSLEPLKDKQILLQPISAIFLKLNVAGRRPPLVAVFKNMEVQDEGMVNNSKDKYKDQVEVFWSYTNEFPCNSDPKDFDGSFREEKIMRVGNPSDHRFPQSHVYMAIYAKSSSFSDSLMYSFGDHALKEIDKRFNAKSKAAAPAQTDETAVAAEKEVKILNARAKLSKFKEETRNNIDKMMNDEEMREQFYDRVSKIKNQRSVRYDQNSGDSPDKFQLSKEFSFTLMRELSDESKLLQRSRVPDPRASLEMHLTQRKERREIQLEQIKQLEIQRHKYRLFLTIKHDILKKVKDEKLDELVAVLRERKFARLHITMSMLIKILRIVWNGLDVLRIRNLQRNKLFLAVLRVFLSFRCFVKHKYGRAYVGPENRDERIRQGFVTKSITAVGTTLHETMERRSKQILYHFLRDRMKLYWGFTVRQRVVMEKIDVIRLTMKNKVSAFRDGMVLIIQEIEDSCRQVKERIKMIKYPQRKEYDWLMDELKAVSGLITSAPNLIPKTFSEVPQMPAAFMDEGSNEQKQPPEKQNQVYRVALQFLRYLQSQHKLDHFKWYVQRQIMVHRAIYGDDDSDSQVPKAKTFKTDFLLRHIELHHAYQREFLEDPSYHQYMPSYPTHFTAATSTSPSKARKRKASKKERSPKPTSELDSILAKGDDDQNGDGDLQAASFQKVAKNLFKKTLALGKKDKKHKQQDDEDYDDDELDYGELNEPSQCDEPTINRLYDEHRIPNLDFNDEPKFEIEEITKECNRAYMAQLSQPRDSVATSTLDPITAMSSLQPSLQASLDNSLFEKGQSWRLQKGLNSLELLYKVLIHYKVDTLRQLEEKKAQRLEEDQQMREQEQ